MSHEETETVIVINEADRREGFFRFGTSNIGHLKKLYKRVGKEYPVLLHESKKDGEITWSEFKVPYHSLASTLGLKKKVGPKSRAPMRATKI